MKKFVTMTVFVFICWLTVKTQNVYHPVILGVSANYTDFHVVDRQFKDFFTKADWMGKHVPTMLRFGRTINPSFNLCAVLSSVTIENSKLNYDQIFLNDTISSSYFWKTGFQIEYKFTNGYLLPHRFWFDPYLVLGVNISSFDNRSYFGAYFGAGSNMWIADYLGVNFQSSYDHLPGFKSYMHYSIGIVTRFGKMYDKDGDRIPNRIDKCPEIFGVEYLAGCPDFDGDGVVDSLDKCPREYGKVSMKGCPDTDNDGIPDVDDRCPDIKGKKIFNGCNEDITEKKLHGESIYDSVIRNDEKLRIESINKTQLQNSDQADIITKSSEIKTETMYLNEIHDSTETKFYIIIGSFHSLENALKFIESQKAKGINSALAGQASNGYYRVSVGFYSSKEEARKVLNKYRRETDKNAWIFKN